MTKKSKRDLRQPDEDRVGKPGQSAKKPGGERFQSRFGPKPKEEEQPEPAAEAEPAAQPAAAAEPAAESGPKVLAVHTVESGDTLSHMALKYYGEATREKWMQIYEANKEQLGEYPGLIRPGDKVIIPELEG